MVRFCDICGTRFEDGDLRPQSRYCPMCGEQLPKWVIQAIVAPSLSHINIPSPSATPALQADPPSEGTKGTNDPTHIERSLSPGTIRVLPLFHEASIHNTSTQQNAPIQLRPGLPESAIPPIEFIHSPLSSEVGDEENTLSTAGEEVNQESESPEDSPSRLSTPTPSFAELSLDIKTYNLPPPFPVPSRYNQAFSRRRVICKLLGGNNQVMYPISKSRKYPRYACPRMDYNPTAPAIHGHHGILITKPIPREFPCDNFVLFVKDMNKSLWYYRGQYRIVRSSYLTCQQWAQQPRQFRNERIRWILNSKDWGHRELNRLGLSISYDNARRAIEGGDIKWEVKVLECIGFDIELYRQLAELADKVQ